LDAVEAFLAMQFDEAEAVPLKAWLIARLEDM